MNLTIDAVARTQEPDVEVVERKGLGHPDTICDALAEEVSRALSAYYLDKVGMILHHNVDKALLSGGRARPAFGGGEVLEPIEIYLAGRAVSTILNDRVPIEELAIEHARAWLRRNFRTLDADRHVQFRCLIRPGSAALQDLYQRSAQPRSFVANDTSCGVGFAPLSSVERLVLQVERQLNSAQFRAQHPEGGEDVKVMAVRHFSTVELTIARAFVGKHLANADEYQAAKRSLLESVQGIAASLGFEPKIDINVGDDPARNAYYLTVTGTSAEAGDDGQVGRGNRVNGLITPYRPMSLEAVAGKNPVGHVGKLYNLTATRIAEQVCTLLGGILGATCFLTSQIGKPITDPQVAHVRLNTMDGNYGSEIDAAVNEIVRKELARIPKLAEELIRGECQLF